ncbi:MAG: pentapeptide repeat-containing protein [Thermoguttaceae bacterium]|nr:pentapeptide repeat-containing protein [Thermoguttaceae bacterium]
MSFRNPSVNLASQNLSFGSIIVSKFVEISNSLINNARIRTIGLDFSNQTDVIILNNKLYSTKSHKTGDLRGVQFYVPIIDCDLTNQNLSGAAFYASVKNTRFDNAIITDCNFYFAKDLTLSQIKSTWNYKNGRMDDAILPERFRNEIESETFYKTKSFQEKKLQQEEFGVSAFRRAPELELPKCYNRLGRTYASMYDNWRDFLLDLEQIKNSVGKKYYLPYACIDSWDLRGMDLSDAIIAASSMKGTNFTNANIDGACFQEKYDKAPLDSDDNLETFGLFLPNPFDEEIYNKEKRGFRGLFTKEQLESTASYKNRRLANMTFTQMCDIRGVDLSGFDLSNTLFITSLAEVNLTDAVITNCVFGGFASKVHKGKYVGSRDYVYPQLTAEQIKSTWNYKHHKMEGIALPEYLRKELGLPSEGDEDSSSRDLDSND